MFVRPLPWLLLFLLAPLFANADEKADPAPGWSPAVKNLAGRLVAKKAAVSKAGLVELFVELQNNGDLALGVAAHDPFAFDLVVKDKKGNIVTPDAERGDILSSPQLGIVPRHSYLGIPVTLTGAEEGKWNLDITTKLWRLAPGQYTLSGKYQMSQFPKPKKARGAAEFEPWHGELVLPETEIEITP